MTKTVFFQNHFFAALLFVAIVLSIALLNNCGPPPVEPTEEEKVTALLITSKWIPSKSGSWVVANGVDVTDLFKDFTITFTATGYTTTGTTPVWPRTDTWKFKTGSTKILVRGADQAEFTIETLDATTLKISLFWNKETTEGGRTNSISGKHQFTFTK